MTQPKEGKKGRGGDQVRKRRERKDDRMGIDGKRWDGKGGYGRRWEGREEQKDWEKKMEGNEGMEWEEKRWKVKSRREK